jgi:mono/diheme cytochrome c family protein
MNRPVPYKDSKHGLKTPLGNRDDNVQSAVPAAVLMIFTRIVECVMSPMVKRSGLAVGVVALMGVAAFAVTGASADTTPAPATVPTPVSVQIPANAAPASGAALTPADHKKMMMQYCTGCHNDRLKTAGMSVVPLDANNLPANLDTWEKILRRVSLGEMPLRGAPRPPKERLNQFTSWLSASLDANGKAHPNPGRATVRRMNRFEYSNAVRDLLAFNVDMSNELPVDDTGYGFDNIADILTVSPTLMDRYINVAGKISRLATGQTSKRVVTADYKFTKDLFENGFGVPSYNERASDELPLDSRGGGVAKFYAPYDATYNIQVYLNSGTGTETEIDSNNRYELKVPLKAGLRSIGVYFPKHLALSESLLPKVTTGARPPKPTDTSQIPLDVQVDGVKVKELSVAASPQGPNVSQAFYLRDVMQVSVQGPFDVKGPGDTASRRKIFICHPSASLSEQACAEKILSTLARHAYRRPVNGADIAPLMKIYAVGRKDATFEQGIATAVQAVLVSPNFLFQRETDPAKSAPGTVHKITDQELATRLSFFLWSSIPDDKLLAVAQSGQLSKPAVLKAQVTRMLADPKAQALTKNFAGQWLYLRKLDYQRPDRRIFPDFDERLRSSMKTETEMFFTGIVQENRSIIDFLDANYTYLNQRLAEHYGIPGVYGTSFRKVQMDPAVHRGGLLGQGSILTVTSYNNRTSVVLRGKWVLENILAAPPPAPPPNIPSLNEVKNGKLMTVREQMEMHRNNPVCASCHTKMEPFGFSLENFNAIGAWRTRDAGQALDVSAVMPDGTKFNGPSGPDGLTGILLSRKNQFADAFTERLMTYALGRGLEGYDMPAVRTVRYAAAKDDYRMQTIIMGIVQSVPFSMRRTPD